jgi:hypothetical protein
VGTAAVSVNTVDAGHNDCCCCCCCCCQGIQ